MNYRTINTLLDRLTQAEQTYNDKILNSEIHFYYLSHRLMFYILHFRSKGRVINLLKKDILNIRYELMSITPANIVKKKHLKISRFTTTRNWVVASTKKQDIATMDAFKFMLIEPYKEL